MSHEIIHYHALVVNLNEQRILLINWDFHQIIQTGINIL